MSSRDLTAEEREIRLQAWRDNTMWFRDEFFGDGTCRIHITGRTYPKVHVESDVFPKEDRSLASVQAYERYLEATG